MKVALALHHVRSTGGQDRYALELARQLATRVDLTIVAMRVWGDLPDGVQLHRVRPVVGPLLLRAPLFQAGADRWLRSRHFDVVHTLGGALPGASVITAPFCHAAWREISPPLGVYQRLVSIQSIADERAAYGHPALRAIIPVSRGTADDLERHYGPLRAPVTVIPNGVDLTRFTPFARSARERPRLLFVGAFGRKGLDVAIRALTQMRHECDLLAVGEGEHGDYAALATELGVSGRVRVETPREDIQMAMADADLLLFPTRYEPFGMVIAESLAAGTPVVTSAVAGAAEYITDPSGGEVVSDAEDSAGFAAAADRVLDRAAAGTSSAAGARALVAGLTWESVAERTLAVYRSVA